MNKIFAVVATLSLLIVLSGTILDVLEAREFVGQAISILDGDTLEVLHNQRPERIRLSGIDCPEKGQAFGNNAKHAASDLAFGKEVTVQTHGHDKYKRTLGDGRGQVGLAIHRHPPPSDDPTS